MRNLIFSSLMVLSTCMEPSFAQTACEGDTKAAVEDQAKGMGFIIGDLDADKTKAAIKVYHDETGDAAPLDAADLAVKGEAAMIVLFNKGCMEGASAPFPLAKLPVLLGLDGKGT